jgi:hypothetical protein
VKVLVQNWRDGTVPSLDAEVRALKWQAIPVMVLSFFLGLVPQGLEGQEGAFAFEFRGGSSVPISSFRSAKGPWPGETGPGASFGMGFTLPAPGPFGSYFGFGQRRFSCQGPLCPEGSEWLSTGFDVDLRLVLGRKRIRPWVRGGLHTHLLEGRVVREGEVVEGIRSDTSAGFEVGGGILVAIGARTSLSPGIHYGWGKVSFPRDPSFQLRYFNAELGLVLGF